MASEIEANVAGILKSLKDINNCHIHIISQSVRFYFETPENLSSTFSIRRFRSAESLLNCSVETWDKDWIFLEPEIIQRDNEDPPVPFNPSQMKRAPECIYGILLFAFNEIKVSYLLNGGYNKTRTYVPYLLALNELQQFYNFHSKEKGYEERIISEPTKLFTLHVSLGSQRLQDETRIHIHKDIHHLNIYNGILDCADANTTSIVEPTNCKSIYFCIHCIVRWQFISVNFTTLTNITTFELFSKLIGTPKTWTVLKEWELSQFNTATSLYDHRKNPFILSSKEQSLPFEFVILSIISSESNSSISIIGSIYSEKRSNEIFPEKRLSMDFKFSIIGMSELGFKQNQFWQTSVVSSEGYNFITCYSKDHLSFSYYFQPFQIELWMALIFYLPILSVLTHLFLIFKKCNKSDFNSYFFAYSSMLEYCYYVPDYLFRMDSVRIVLGLWLLISCIFTNAYKGLAITGVTAPAEKSSVKTFAELVDDNITYDVYFNSSDPNLPFHFKILTPFTVEYLDTWKMGEWDLKNKTTTSYNSTDENSTTSEKDYRYRYTVEKADYFPFLIESYNEFWKLNRKQSICLSIQYPHLYPGESFKPNDQSHLRACGLAFKLGTYQRYIVPKREMEIPQFSKNYEIAAERELVQCDEQIAYVDYEEKVNREHEYLSGHYYHKTFFKGNQSYLKDWTVWQFDNGRGSRLPEIFQLLIQNGIYKKLEIFYKNRVYFGVRNEYTRMHAFKEKYEPVKKLNLKSNVQTVFYMFLSGILISIMWISVEAFQFFVVEVMKFLRYKWRNHMPAMLACSLFKWIHSSNTRD
ncbi:unnamed protein product [Orchesella dallaii]|uniref:Uncharacterized protein n=1 Tax=Orchesella dallaii TaxID=48710 RepID=A0ABP1S8C4_9HEXA